MIQNDYAVNNYKVILKKYMIENINNNYLPNDFNDLKQGDKKKVLQTSKNSVNLFNI